MKTIATVTSKGQITIPKLVRQLLGVHAGDQLEFELDRGKVEMRVARPGRTSAGVLRRHLPREWKAPSVAAMDSSIAGYLARKHRPR